MYKYISFSLNMNLLRENIFILSTNKRFIKASETHKKFFVGFRNQIKKYSLIG